MGIESSSHKIQNSIDLDTYNNIADEILNTLFYLDEQVQIGNKSLIVVPTTSIVNLAEIIAKQNKLNISTSISKELRMHPVIQFCYLVLQSSTQRWNHRLSDSIEKIFSVERDDLNKLHELILSTSQCSEIFTILNNHLAEISQHIINQYNKIRKAHDFIGYDIAGEPSNIVNTLSQTQLYGNTDMALSVLERAIRSIEISKLNSSSVNLTDATRLPEINYEHVHLCSLSNNSQLDEILDWGKIFAEKITMSSYRTDLVGTKNILPAWAIMRNVVNKQQLIRTDDIQHPEVEHLEKMISNELNDVNSMSIANPTRSLSPTGVELYARCPSRYFYQNILKISEPNIRNDLYDYARVYGTFIHACLEEIVSKKNYDVDKVIQSNQEYLARISIQTYIDEFISRARLILKHFIQYELEHPTLVIELEKNIHGTILNANNPIYINGKIDRIHTKGSQTYMVDYKTGRPSTSIDPLDNGRRIQLALYALFLDKQLDAIEYWHLRNEGLTIEMIRWDNEIQHRSNEIIQSIATMLEQGIFIARPQIQEVTKMGSSMISNCETCPYEMICTNEARSLWNIHKHSSPVKEYEYATTSHENQEL